MRSPRKGNDGYQEDTDALGAIHDLGRDRPGLAIVVIPHNRKDDHSDDYVDALSGTTGITGVADHIAVLQRRRGDADAVLRFTSRDAVEHDTAYRFDQGVWTELGDGGWHEMSRARREILGHLDVSGGSATLTALAALAGRAKPTVLDLLKSLEREGIVRQDRDRGPWRLARTANTPNGAAEELGLFVDLANPGGGGGTGR